MKTVQRYQKGYFLPPQTDWSWIWQEYPQQAPHWCSVDLRDGNQALVTPMCLEEKIAFYQMLLRIGFKEIEVGFPAASETEYQFLRYLVTHDLIPEEVTIQVLTQARENIIKKTFAALKDVPRAVVHVYNSTSLAQRQQVFRKSRREVKELAVQGAELVREWAEKTAGNFRFEYSPESFTGTEPEYALEVCNAVLDVWQPSVERKAIINLPATVEMSLPHVFAAQVAYMSRYLHYREATVLSVHPHNDRGTGIAAAEMALLAGAERLEGTLFGNGERTGNVDLVTVAMNMKALGVATQLDFSFLPDIVSAYETLTRMTVPPRQPYAGKLVFAAFSGSHQDAIAKGMHFRREHPQAPWTCPYLYIDPQSVGRTYDADVIRINSQSGKGGVAFVLEEQYGLQIPKALREDFSYYIKGISDRQQRELQAAEIYQLFRQRYEPHSDGMYVESFAVHKTGNRWQAKAVLVYGAEKQVVEGVGNGQLQAITNGICAACGLDIADLVYSEHDLDGGTGSRGMAYIGITDKTGITAWGIGVDTDTMTAAVQAFTGAVQHHPVFSKQMSFQRRILSAIAVGGR